MTPKTSEIRIVSLYYFLVQSLPKYGSRKWNSLTVLIKLFLYLTSTFKMGKLRQITNVALQTRWHFLSKIHIPLNIIGKLIYHIKIQKIKKTLLSQLLPRCPQNTKSFVPTNTNCKKQLYFITFWIFSNFRSNFTFIL